MADLELKGYRIGLGTPARARSLDSNQSGEGNPVDRDVHGCPKHGSGRQTFRVRKPAKLETATRDRGFESLRARYETTFYGLSLPDGVRFWLGAEERSWGSRISSSAKVGLLAARGRLARAQLVSLDIATIFVIYGVHASVRPTKINDPEFALSGCCWVKRSRCRRRSSLRASQRSSPCVRPNPHRAYTLPSTR